jgi:hypothetical protein
MNADDKIRELVQTNLLSNHQVEGVQFVDELLLVAAEVGEIKCSLSAGAQGLCFQTPEPPAWEVELGRANSKLRMICARLAVLCANGATPDIYGGEGTIAVDMPSGSENGEKTTNPTLLQVQFDNKPGKVWFTLHAEKRVARVVRESERVRA